MLAPSDTVAVLSIARQDFLSFDSSATCGDVVARFSDAAHKDDVNFACLKKSDGRFLGLVNLRDCLAEAATRPAREMMIDDVTPLTEDTTAEDAARKVLRTRVHCLPVLDKGGRIRGLLPDQAAYQFMFDMADEDAAKMAGIVGVAHDHDNYMNLTIWQDYRRRIPWIFGLAVAGLAAGLVVHAYESALDVLVILALYMPMIADTGGNVGTQSASLITRAISFGSITTLDAGRVLWRELRVALLVAATLFVFTYLKVYFLSNGAEIPMGLGLNDIGIAIGVAIAVQVVSATLIGAVLPVVSVALRQDPAVVSGPALTTIVDLTGLLIYFSVTTRLLGIELAPA